MYKTIIVLALYLHQSWIASNSETISLRALRFIFIMRKLWNCSFNINQFEIPFFWYSPLSFSQSLLDDDIFCIFVRTFLAKHKQIEVAAPKSSSSHCLLPILVTFPFNAMCTCWGEDVLEVWGFEKSLCCENFYGLLFFCH